jgi:CheY-like chemotaxis protein
MKMAKILVVDDDQGHRTLISRVLIGAGYETLLAEDGREALDLMRGTPLDLVITDMVMPELDGLELVAALQGEFPKVPIIAVSGTSAAKLNKSARLGAHAILVKPVDPTELLEEVERALGG